MIFESCRQGSEEWLKLRKTKITATDAAIIMGASHFMTMSQLYDEKIGLMIPEPATSKMLQGQKLEPEARNLFNKTLKMDCEPAVVISEEWPWLISSLDGISSDHKRLLEIKCSDFYYRSSINGDILNSNMCQMQQQMAVTGIDHVFYFCYWKGKYSSTTVERDQDFIDEMIPKLYEFWKCLQDLTLPKGYNEDRFVRNV